MKIVKEYVFFNPDNEDIDEIIDKASSDCSYRYTHSYKPLDLIYKIKKLDMKKIKPKFKYHKIHQLERCHLDGK